MTKNDGLVNSPDAALRYILRHCGVRASTPHSSGIARLIASGKVVGWFQGRMEWGPRALGNRSILADLRSDEMQKHLNLKIKFRESFRPFAPSVLIEDAGEYFDIDTESPYMLLVAPVVTRRRKETNADDPADIRERLYRLRSDIPAVTHIDYSARIQTVHMDLLVINDFLFYKQAQPPWKETREWMLDFQLD